ncbi:Alpha/Beta hydrolase protein [Aspergillus granulosus]|uniref:Alpha/Beta hydrolase protein n=1 Tax=Aspergillus granulosus TaxID=176169 RepID=A0ABR4HG16_9EURO
MSSILVAPAQQANWAALSVQALAESTITETQQDTSNTCGQTAQIQPIGVGFSQITNRSSIAVSLQDRARDIYRFLTTLTTDIFPHLAGRPWHITGESMGGHYITGYTKYIARLKHENAALGIKPRINISSAVIVDRYINASRQVVGYYNFFCTD